jgi:hypothetical protein
MSRRTSRGVAAALTAGGVALLVTSFAAVAFAEGETGVGFFDVTADATGIGVSFGDPASQPYPVAAGFLPNSNAQLSAGPSGQARASILWPGPLLGNAGSLANVIGTPLPPEVVSNANYPIVAQASSGAGGSDSDTLGPMTAKVEGGDSRASTSLSDVSAPGVVSAARVITTSRSYLENGRAVSVAESVLEGVDVGGVVKIATVRTVARGVTDGVAATTSQEVTLSGVTVGDQPATIDREGLHVGGGTAPVGGVLDAAKPAFDGFGMKAFITDPLKQEASGGAALIESGSVVFEWSPPGSGQFFTVVLGGSSVRVRATPGSEFGGVGGVDDGLFSPADPATVLPTPGLSPLTESALSVGGAVDTGATSPSPGPVAGVAAPIQSGAPLELAAAVSDRVPLGWVLVGMVGALLAASGLHRFRDQALAAAVAGSRCPLEGSTP